MQAINSTMWTDALPHGETTQKLNEEIKQIETQISDFEAFRGTLGTQAPHGVISSSAKGFAVMIENKYYKEKLPLTGENHFDGSIHEIYKQKRKHPKGSSEYKLLDAEQINLTAGAADLNTKIDAAREFRGLTFTSELKDLTEENKAILQGFVTYFNPEKTKLEAELTRLKSQRDQIGNESNCRVRAHMSIALIVTKQIELNNTADEITSLQQEIDAMPQPDKSEA